MKTKIYLLFLLVIIMGAGARTMFEIAYHGMAREHEFAPGPDTVRLIFLALWFVAMMMADVVLLRNQKISNRNILIALLSIGVSSPVIFMLLTK